MDTEKLDLSKAADIRKEAALNLVRDKSDAFTKHLALKINAACTRGTIPPHWSPMQLVDAVIYMWALEEVGRPYSKLHLADIKELHKDC